MHFIVRFYVHLLFYTDLNNPKEVVLMDNLQRISSMIQHVNGETITLFVGSEAGHVGLVQAGTWETVLPFRFDRIIPLADGTLAAFQGSRRTVYQAALTSRGIRMIPAAGERRRPGGIALPA